MMELGRHRTTIDLHATVNTSGLQVLPPGRVVAPPPAPVFESKADTKR